MSRGTGDADAATARRGRGSAIPKAPAAEADTPGLPAEHGTRRAAAAAALQLAAHLFQLAEHGVQLPLHVAEPLLDVLRGGQRAEAAAAEAAGPFLAPPPPKPPPRLGSGALPFSRSA